MPLRASGQVKIFMICILGETTFQAVVKNTGLLPEEKPVNQATADFSVRSEYNDHSFELSQRQRNRTYSLASQPRTQIGSVVRTAKRQLRIC